MQTLEKVPDFLLGGGEMGERIRKFDWSKTSLGAPENWGQALKTSLSICLNSNFPIALYWGEDLTLLYNDAWSPIPGNKHPWALGKPAKEVWKDIWKEIEPEFKKAFERIPGGSKDALLPMQRRGYTEECYFDFTFTPVTGTRGKVEGVFNAVIETTYRVITERRSNFLNQLSLVLASAYTHEKVFEQLNNFFKRNNAPISFAFFYSENNHTQNLFASTHNIKEIQFKKPLPFNKVLEQKKLFLVENVHDYLNNVPKGYWDEEPVEAVMLPIIDLDTSISYFIVCGLNARHRYNEDYKTFFESLGNIITKVLNTIASLEQERKRAEALAEIDKAKTLFFTNISHEFRTPLTLMLGPIEEALNDSKTRPDNAKRMDVAHRNAVRLLKLVNTLLDFSRIESGRQRARFSLTDIASFTKNLVSNFRAATEKAGLKLIVNADSNLPNIYIDKEMWEKIIFNLLSNAFKYTLNGSITVEIISQNNNAVLKVKDTGIGIPENELPHMFERFHRVQKIGGRSFEGTGIGLSLTKELVLLNRGEIFVESKEGVGSTFTVTIPFGKEHIDASEIENDDANSNNLLSEIYVEEANILLENTSSETERESPKKIGTQSQPLVMIVDDNVDMRKHIETLLSPKFNVIAAVNGEDALEKLTHKKPELILSDVMMPVMDGIQLLKEVKSNKTTEQIPVILLTARAGEESKIEGWETGADDYLVKPFSSKELIARITTQINLTKKRLSAEKQLVHIFKHAPVGIVIYRGADFVIDLANEQALEMWGKKFEEVQGRALTDVFPEIITTEHIKTLYDASIQKFNKGESFNVNEAELTFQRNGDLHTGWYNYIHEPIKDVDGKITGIIATAIDVSQQVLARKKIEHVNRELEYSATVSDSIADAVIGTSTQDENYSITGWNKAAELMYGWKAEEVIGKSAREIININPSEEHRKLWQNIMDTNGFWKGEIVQTTKNGKEINVLASVAYVKNRDGKILGTVAVNRDVSEQKEAEAALRRAKEQLEIMFKNVPSGIYQFNNQGNIELINERGAKLLGYDSVDHVMAAPGMQQFVNHLHNTFIVLDEAGNKRPDEKGSVYIAITTGKSAQATSQFINKKDGMALWLLSNSTPVYNEAGKLSFVLTTVTDVTESKNAEIALRESENRFRTLAEALPQMVWVRNANGIIEYGSKGWQQYSGIKNISEAWKAMLHPDEWDMIMKRWEEDSKAGTPFRYEVRLKNKEGEYRWHYTAGEPVKDESGKVLKWIGALTDMHVQKTFSEKLEQEVAERTEDLVKANKELESFNYIASHDLQEPLRKIQTFIALINKNPGDVNTKERYFEKIRLSAQRMSELIQSILSYTRLSKSDEAHLATDLNKVLIDVETDFELLIKERDAKIQSSKLPVIKSNPLQMHQLFSNLISNALKFSDKHPEIRITSEIVSGDKIKLDREIDPKQKFALITFADNGIGFDSKFKEQIFQLFQRLHGKESYAGTGIGLSIVKKIVEQHNGFVKAESLNGKGAIFSVWLPVE